ncbi:MAG TPA: response regulator [Candidatus Latescibacteria bacterium]|nr:response regulator [Candidatus Latescibacterota bacterium]
MNEGIRGLIEQVPVLSADESVGKALERLFRGPIPFALVRLEGRWRYVTAATLAGVPWTRALMDTGLPEAVEVPPDLPIEEALKVLEREGREALVVVEGGRPLGVLRRSNVLRHLLDQARKTRETAEELAAVFKTSPLPILLVDRKLRVLEMNEVLSEYTGVAFEQAVGRPGGEVLGCVHAEEGPRGCGFAPACRECGFRRAVLATFRTGRPHRDVEAAVPIRRGGEVRELYLLVNTAPLARGEEGAVVVALQDITERRQLLQKLQELNESLERRVQERTFELQVLYELADQIGHTLNYGDLFRLVLQYLHRILPYDVAGSLFVMEDVKQMFIKKARPLAEEIVVEIKRIMLEGFEKAGGMRLRPEEVGEVVFEALDYRADAPPLPSLGSTLLVPLAVGGRTIGLVFAGAEAEEAFRRERRHVLYALVQQAAISVQRLQALLLAEQTRLEAAIEDMREGVVILDGERFITVANSRAREFLPLLTKARLGGERPMRQLGGMGLEAILEITRGGRHQEVVVPGPPERTFEITASPFGRGREGLGGTVVVIRDVTEEREARRREAQQERLAAIGQMAGGIAHDFNNILSAMMGYAEIALMRAGSDSQLREYLKTIITQGRRAADLIRRVLDFSRRSVSEPRALDLLSFLKEAMKLLKRTIPERIDLRFTAEPGRYMVHVDPTQIQQIVMNLAINARDAMPEGGKLEVRLEKVNLGEEARLWDPDMVPGPYIRMTVKDTGVGMPPEVLDKAFEPFFTTKGPGEGTGLGLSQVYGIVKQHGGYVSIESEVGKGTSVHVYLPELVREVTPEAEAKEAVPTGTETVLVVEDEGAVRDALRMMLGGLGYRVLTASDGEEGLRVYRERRGEVDLVLLDMVMPKLDGRRLYREVRKLDPGAKVLVLSGYSPGEEVQELLAEGAMGFVQKPVVLNELAQKVREALDRPGPIDPDLRRKEGLCGLRC